MKIVFGAVALLFAPAAIAQTAPAPAAPAASAAKLNLDTPIETIVADAQGKAVLEANLPGVTTHPAYDQFKGMSLRAVQPMSQGAITEEKMKAIETGLAAIK